MPSPDPYGRGGTPPKPVNAPSAPTGTAVQPGVPPVLQVSELIVSGPGEGIFSYSSKPPAFGNLVMTAGLIAAGTDPYGNAYLPGLVSYKLVSGTWFAAQVWANTFATYTSSSAGGPWAEVGVLGFTSLGDLVFDTQGLTWSGFIPQPAPAPDPYGIVAGLQAAGIFR